MQSCGMQQEKDLPTPNIMDMLLCFCGPTKYNALASRISFFLHYQESHRKVELTKKVTGKSSTIPCRRYDNCLDAANLYSRTINPSTKACVF